MQKSHLAIAISSVIGISGTTLPSTTLSATLNSGYYDMVINNTPFSRGDYQFGADGAWNSSFTFGCMPGTTPCSSNAMYDDTVASPVNGHYGGNVFDGVQGTVPIRIWYGEIIGLGGFEFDTIPGTAGGDFAQYGGSLSFSGNIDDDGNISFTPTGTLATVGDFVSLVDEAWNVDNFNGVTGTVPNPANSNTAFDSFTTGSATNAFGTINGAAYDGSTAVLVKGGSIGDAWGGFFGTQYFEVWNVSFNYTGPTIFPIPATVWLFGSGLLGLIGVARRKKAA